jgi:RNA polymerase sigma-70 factor, ECF subfamily
MKAGQIEQLDTWTMNPAGKARRTGSRLTRCCPNADLHAPKKNQRIFNGEQSYQTKTAAMADQGDEQEWIRRSREGDLEAFAALVKRYQRMIDALAYRMTGSLHDAADVSQEVFLQAHRRLSGFEGRAKFSSWLHRIAVNICLDWRRAEARRCEVYTQWASAQENGPPLSEDASTELSRRVQAALLKLPARQRAAVVLTTYDGLSHADAAKALGCSETTVSWRLFTARRKLKRILSRSDSA